MLSSQRQRHPHSRSSAPPARGSWFILTAVILVLLAAFKVSTSKDVELSFRREIERIAVNKPTENAKVEALRELFEKVTKEKLVLTQEQVVLQQEKLVLQQRVRELEASIKQRSDAISSPISRPNESPTTIPISRERLTDPHPGLSAGSASHVHAKSRVHRLAILVPYRNREEHAKVFVPAIQEHLRNQGVEFQIFFLEQADHLNFNRGLLLNAGVLILQHSGYDHFSLHDVDTIPGVVKIPYTYPEGDVPMHLTPPGIHPSVDYVDFFGGNTIFTLEQFQRVNGYGTHFWGWGKEDDNLRERLQKQGMWPTLRPKGCVPWPKQCGRARPGYYFKHQTHAKEPEMRAAGGGKGYVKRNPDHPYGSETILNVYPEIYQDFGKSGLNTTKFELVTVETFYGAIKLRVELSCDKNITPWCDASRRRRRRRR